MREIKFRCHNKKTQKMWDADSLRNMGGFALQSGHSSNEFLVLPYPNDDYVLMQYTGLKDKNGVEIYEGDILAGCNGSINGTGWNWGNYSVSFKDGKFDVPLWGTFERHDSTHWFEVIGNIYEHPNLLENE